MLLGLAAAPVLLVVGLLIMIGIALWGGRQRRPTRSAPRTGTGGG